jgi:hypothetical protein
MKSQGGRNRRIWGIYEADEIAKVDEITKQRNREVAKSSGEKIWAVGSGVSTKAQ